MFLLLFAIVSCTVPYALTGPRDIIPEVFENTQVPPSDDRLTEPPAYIDIMSINMAHGRCDAYNHLYHREPFFRENVKNISKVLRREQPRLVALQEADGPCWWSGDFDQVAKLALEAEYRYAVRAENVKGLGLSYGTALLGQLPIEETHAHTFPPTPPTFTKGFVLIDTHWPGRPDFKFTFCSVHLDFARTSKRREQILEMIAYFKEREKPLVVLGDFNTKWTNEDGLLKRFAEELQLKTHDPENDELITFPTTGSRLDWIFVSEEFEMKNFRILDDVISDHRAVTCELHLRELD